MAPNDKTEYLTKEKHDSLVRELHELKTVKRAKVARDLEYAKSLGDLSENAEYHEAREAQTNLEERIAKIATILKHVSILTNRHSSKVEVGSTVVLKKTGDREETRLQVVGSEEADATQGKISNNSPIGRAMLGKKKGDTFEVSTPKGIIGYTILYIE